MKEPMTRQSQLVGSRLFKAHDTGSRYHAMPISETVNRIVLCGCVGRIRLGNKYHWCGRRVQNRDARFARNYSTHSIWA